MKSISSKFRLIVIVLVVKLAGCLGCAQCQAATNEKTNDMIDNSQAARWKLRHAGILSIPSPQTSEPKVQLRQVIKNVQSLKPPKPKPTPSSEVLPAQALWSTGSANKPEPASPQPDKSKTPKTPPADQTGLALAALLDNPQNVINPLAAAEALFHRGNLKDAAKFYSLALKRMADRTDHPDRPWALFQAANCFRHDNPATALKLYQQLIAEYPASDWTAAAHSQQQIIAWHQQNISQNLLEKYISDPNSQ